MGNIIDLYENIQIAQFTTADNPITKLIAANTDKEKKKASQRYEKVYNTHRDKAPLGERMQEAKEENKRIGRSSKPEVRSCSMSITKASKDTMKASFKDSRGRSYIPFCLVPQTVNIKANSSVEDLIRKQIFRFDKDDFHKITQIPIFIHFAAWKPFDYKRHDYQARPELTLYLVNPKSTTMFSNKSYGGLGFRV